MEKSFTFQSNMKTFDREDGEETYLKERECKGGKRNTTVSLGFQSRYSRQKNNMLTEKRNHKIMNLTHAILSI